MPPTAKRVSGAAGHGRRLRGEGADLVRRLGDQQHADEGQDQDRALNEQGRLVDRHRPDRYQRAGVAAVEDRVRGGQHDGQDERAREAAERERYVHGPAQDTGSEGLHQHAGDGHAEDQEHRRQQAVLDMRCGDGRLS
jgi:hypothetical protein